MNEIEKEKPFEGLSPEWGLVAIACGLPFYFLFAQLGAPGRGRAAAIIVGVGVGAIRARWDLRKYRWFWFVVITVAVLHIPALSWLSWSNKSYPGLTLMPIGLVDFGVYVGFIALAEKVAKAYFPSNRD